MSRNAITSSRTGRIYGALIAFLLGFGVLLLIVLYGFLAPATNVVRDATEEERRGLAAYSWLLLALLLVILFLGLLMAFRVRRYFASDVRARTQTQYTDAWAEAGKRARVSARPDEDETDDARDAGRS